MDRAYQSGAAVSAPSAPASPSTGYPTAGNPGSGTPATTPGPYWYHMIMEELMAVISAAGIEPAQGNLTQLLTALRSAGVFQTAPQFDNDTSVATTEFVQRALGNMAGFEIFTASQVLNAASAGKYLIFTSSGSLTCTLPNPSGLPVGTRIYVESSGGGSLAVSASGGADFAGPNSGSSPLSTVTLRSGVSAEFIVQSATRYRFVGGSGDVFLASSGYQKLPSGLIIQWGGGITGIGGSDFSFPIAFPNACRQATISPGTSGANVYINGVSFTQTTITGQVDGNGSSFGRYIAIGY